MEAGVSLTNFYGAGTRQLGDLGPSFGWSVLMGSMVLAANLLGVATGEWRQAPPGALRQLWLGAGLLCAAVLGLGIANRLGT